jgi:hypothetical protein
MLEFVRFIWKRCKDRALGRLFAAILIAGTIGFETALSHEHRMSMGVLGLVGGVSCAVIAWLILEISDRRKEKSPEWRHRVQRTAHRIQQTKPELSPAHVMKAAVRHERNRITPITRIGIAMGLVIVLCGILATILKLVKNLRQ